MADIHIFNAIKETKRKLTIPLGDRIDVKYQRPSVTRLRILISNRTWFMVSQAGSEVKLQIMHLWLP